MRGLSTLVLIAALAAAATTASGQTPSASLCLETDPGCLTPGGTQVRVVLDAGQIEVCGAQVDIHFDPQVLALIDVVPGRECDPDSPFSLELFQSVHPSGEVRYAVGTNFLTGKGGAHGQSTVACLRFAPVGPTVAAVDVCLVEGEHPFLTMLVDEAGRAISVFASSTCGLLDVPSTLACTQVTADPNCTCETDTADCHALDTACRIGVCNPATHFCEAVAINEGGSCDDGDSCTLIDECREGECEGRECRNPTLCLGSDSCLGLDPIVGIAVRLSQGQRVVDGGQFSIEYDPTELEFLDALPGSYCDPDSPFTLEITQVVNETEGRLFFAAGVSPGGPSGTNGPSTLACLTFLDIGEPGGKACLFNDLNPFSTILVDEFGQAIRLGDFDVCESIDDESGLPCAGPQPCRIPTVSAWGGLILALLLLCGAKVRFGFQARRSFAGRA